MRTHPSLPLFRNNHKTTFIVYTTVVVVTILHILSASSASAAAIGVPSTNKSKTIDPNERMSRIAAITGANKGIGYHIALQLAQSGRFTHIVLACRDQSRGLEAQQKIQHQLQLKAKGGEDGGSNVNVDVSYEQLTIGDEESHTNFYNVMNDKYGGKVDVLINNAAIAFKGSDPTPFQKQCKPTLDVNFRGTLNFTDKMMPLLRKGNDARIVNVASMAGGLKQLKSTELKQKFTDIHLTKEKLILLVDQFERDVMAGTHLQNGWGGSNYGMSKLALIALTKVWAREEASNGIKVNCCCPGYCDTDMTSHKGPRPPSDGARNAVIPATMEQSECPTGEYFANCSVSNW